MLKKTFKGKAIAIVKPFSNVEKKVVVASAASDLYDFKSDEDGEVKVNSKVTTTSSPKVESSQAAAGLKRLKKTNSVKKVKGLGDTNPGNPSPTAELRAVRVRLEKFTSKQNLSTKPSPQEEDTAKSLCPKVSDSSSLEAKKEPLSEPVKQEAVVTVSDIKAETADIKPVIVTSTPSEPAAAAVVSNNSTVVVKAEDSKIVKKTAETTAVVSEKGAGDADFEKPATPRGDVEKSDTNLQR